MKILIVSATHAEIAKSIHFLEKFHIPYLVTGVGMIATTFALTNYLANNPCDYIINIGIAGSFAPSIPIGTVVEVNKDIFSELGAEDKDKFINIDTLGFGKSTFENIKHEILSTSLPYYTGITVNTVHGDDSSIRKIKNRLPDISIETMEGAAVFYVAHQHQIPAIQVRAISNYVEARNKSNWNIPLAVENLNIWLQEYLEKFIN